jgi:hypothetical protein
MIFRLASKALFLSFVEKVTDRVSPGRRSKKFPEKDPFRPETR